MARWEPDARGRLAEAALELYAERGYEQTTVADIAGRAGLTERTFFRHYADKREVLFGGPMPELVEAALREAPAGEGALAVGRLAMLAAAGALPPERRPFARKRQAVIDATPALQERELLKLDSFARLIDRALTARGEEPAVSRIVAETSVALFKVAFAAWIDGDGGNDLTTLTEGAFVALGRVSAG
ncbi:MAG: TetR family transcriptional regulator [Solirubrobacteraceae bacterium]|nr:TetR family transcriptional regulator [Solirubrobacteraceae bacterium]